MGTCWPLQKSHDTLLCIALCVKNVPPETKIPDVTVTPPDEIDVDAENYSPLTPNSWPWPRRQRRG